MEPGIIIGLCTYSACQKLYREIFDFILFFYFQVMYMYYLLGYKLVAQPLDARRKQTIADNTFILALDGDVDFKPSAVQLLVDRMRKNEKVGAACGRIHPIGTGTNSCGISVRVHLFDYQYETGYTRNMYVLISVLDVLFLYLLLQVL